MITTDSGAKKIEGTDNWRGIFDAHNDTADALEQLAEDTAIIVNGNKTTHTGGAASGQYVLVRNSTITDITDGLYTASQAIPANTVIDKTYLTAVSGGGLNALNNKLGPQLKSLTFTATSEAGGYVDVPLTIDGVSTATDVISIVSARCTSNINIACTPFAGSSKTWRFMIRNGTTGETAGASSRIYSFYYVDR